MIEVFIFQIIVMILLGAALGSFATAITHRTRHGESWVFNKSQNTGRSACPFCHAPLGVKDLVPILSYLFLKGRCRHCSKPISQEYVWIEIISVLFALGVYGVFGFSFITFWVLSLWPFFLSLLIVAVGQGIYSLLLMGIMSALLIAGVCVIYFSAV